MEETKGYAVVTGSNKGIGFEICKQLALNGFIVVLTARDVKRGLEAVQKLKESGLNNVLFHLLDVADPATIQPLVDFVTSQFGKLDILVNNAGISGISVATTHEFSDIVAATQVGESRNWNEFMSQTYDLAVQCCETNYYGVKRMCEALIPILQLTNSPRIINVSSIAGMLKNVKNEWAKGTLEDAENLTEEKIDEVLKEFLKDFKEGSLGAKGWPKAMSAYMMSKASVNGYTRILAKKFPSFCINCVCPGYANTDINLHSGPLTVEDAADSIMKLALMSNEGPSGLFFNRKELSPF